MPTVSTASFYEEKAFQKFRGTVGFSDGIESNNIVGYSTYTSQYQALWQRGGEFNTIGVGVDGYSIQSFVPAFPADAAWELGDNEAQIQTVDDSGIVDAVYYYLPAGSANATQGAGWYTFDGSTYAFADKKFVRGESFLYMAPYVENEGEEEVPTTLQNAGEVNLTAKTLTSPYQALWLWGNCRPVETSIQKMVPSFPAEAAWELGDNEAQIQTLDDSGLVNAVYFYLPAGSGNAKDGAGWYTFDGSVYTFATKVFAPGEGFIYMAPYVENEGEEEIETYLTFGE